ncbi:phage baseplate protein [Streptomyces sp. NPDC001809]
MAHSDLIDLTGPWGRILSGTPLNHETHTRAGQSMAVDPVTHELFVVQVRGVPTDSDLCVYRMDRRTGRPIDTMHLTGFGHGNQIGAQHLNGTTHLWTDAGPLSGDYGTRVARVPYRPGQTLTLSSPGVTTPFRPTPDAEQSSPNVDPVHHRLTVRYITGAAGEERVFFRQYPIDPVTGEVTWTATRTIELPLGGFFVNHKTPTPQGFASLGEYLYLYTGSPEKNNTHITAVSWTDGSFVAGPQHITAVPGLDRREPEGMCIEPMGDEARLLFGFSGSLTTPREATICFLSTDAPVQGVKLLTDWTALTGVSGATPQTGVMSPRGRLVSLAGTTFLQLRGGFDCDLAAEGPFAQLPPTLTPSRTVRAEVTRNNQGGRCVCRVEVDSRGRLSVFGPTADNRITWIGLDNFSAAWR